MSKQQNNTPEAIAERFATMQARVKRITKECRQVGQTLVESAGIDGSASTEFVDAMRSDYRKLLVAQGAYRHARSRFGGGAVLAVSGGSLTVSYDAERLAEVQRPKLGALADLMTGGSGSVE